MNRQVGRIALPVLAALAFQACVTAGAYFGATSPPGDQILYISNQSEPRSLDPHKTAGVPESAIMLNLYDCLTTYDPKTSEPIPCIATSWESNADASVWTFHLRSDATWTDGRPLTADDFVYSWRRLADPATASPYANLIYYVKNGEAINDSKLDDITQLGVRAIDAHTLEVTMERPTAFFLAMTPHYAFAAVPQWAIEAWGDQWVTPEHNVSSGPYRLVKRVPYDRIVLEKWNGHWDAARCVITRAVYLPVEDQNTAVNLYKAKEVYVLAGGGQSVPTSFVKALRGKKDFHINAEYGTYYYSLNVRRPPLNDARVRRALALSIDKKEICEKYLGAGQIPAYDFVPPGTPGYPYPDVPKYDPDLARKLLAEAGYPNGAGFPKIEIFFNTLESHRQLAELIQSMWKEQLNIPVELNNQEWQVFQATREQRRFDVARDGWIADYLDPNTFLDLFQADTFGNHSGWLNPKYTALMEKANSDPDPQRRLAMLAQAEAILLDDMPIIPIYYYASVGLKKPFLDGWYFNPLDQHPLKFVSINNDWRPDQDTGESVH
ncbi:MAG TPA: peptide ABC transporter substrate-binding protein [Blastocatellia bacterium]|nr:peptide ABC transporter substrate-binding protein [Blastocatellia bacterium]